MRGSSRLPREGSFSYRDQLVATGAAQPRSVTRYNEKGEKETSADEKFVPQKTIEKILRDVEIEKLAALAETLRGLSASLAVDQGDHDRTCRLREGDRVSEARQARARDGGVRRAAALVTRDPTLAPAPEPAAGAGGEGEAAPSAAAPAAFATRADVDAALASALGYFATSEPTSPALLLIRQARETLGKNLYEVMQLLAPPHADNARVFVGPDGAFTVPVKSLAGAPSAELARAASRTRAVARRGAGADRRGRPAHAARRAVEPGPVSPRSGAEPRLAGLRQPAPRRAAGGGHRVPEEGQVRAICPGSVRNVVQSGESACRFRRR